MTSHQFHFRSCPQQCVSPLQVAGIFHTQEVFSEQDDCPPFAQELSLWGMLGTHLSLCVKPRTLRSSHSGGEVGFVLPSSPALAFVRPCPWHSRQRPGCVPSRAYPQRTGQGFPSESFTSIMNSEYFIHFRSK